jgi:hypothetical protein
VGGALRTNSLGTREMRVTSDRRLGRQGFRYVVPNMSSQKRVVTPKLVEGR